MAEPAADPDPADELLVELARFADREADDLARLAAHLRELRGEETTPTFDIESIWASVERHIELESDTPTTDGGSEKG